MSNPKREVQTGASLHHYKRSGLILARNRAIPARPYIALFSILSLWILPLCLTIAPGSRMALPPWLSRASTNRAARTAPARVPGGSNGIARRARGSTAAGCPGGGCGSGGTGPLLAAAEPRARRPRRRDAAIPRDDLHTGPFRKPMSGRVGRALPEHVDDLAAFQVDHDCAVGMTLPPCPVVDADHARIGCSCRSAWVSVRNSVSRLCGNPSCRVSRSAGRPPAA